MRGRVIAQQKASADAFFRLYIDNGATLEVTGEHPVATIDGYVNASEIEPGVCVRTRDGEAHVSQVELVDALVDVYDLTVEPEPNFLAGGILVHNKSYVN